MARACRPIRAFVSDFSTWHVRRSRDRFKSDHQNNKKDALATTRYVLRELSKLIAPIMPFMAEEIYQKVKDSADPLSVHLTSWPQGGEIDKSVLGSMELVRRLSSLALEARSKANIKVRQPLSGLKIRSKGLDREFLDLIRDELNVKDVIVDNSLASEIELDLNLTPMLIEEGKVRDAIRIIQDKRKELGMKPSEKMKYDLPSGQEEFFRKHALEIMKVTNVEF
jgi:isoleucyl-tRNA synthetase